MTLDLAKLRAETLALIDGTTPGPWYVNGPKKMEIVGRVHRVLNPEDYPAAFVPAWDQPEPGEVDGTDEAIANARLIAAAPTLAADNLRLLEENERLRTALEQIAMAKYGLQSIMEDYSDTNAFNYQAMQYWCNLAQGYEATARAALAEGEMK